MGECFRVFAYLTLWKYTIRICNDCCNDIEFNFISNNGCYDTSCNESFGKDPAVGSSV